MLLTITTIGISLFTMLIGMLFILSPVGLVKINEIANTILLKDRFFFTYPKITGAILTLAGIWMLWIYFIC